VLTSEDANEINAKTEALQSAFHKVSEAMYERAQQQAAAEGAPSGNGASQDGPAAAEEDVVDAEVVDEGQ
jgi:molecular chaperone DnaK